MPTEIEELDRDVRDHVFTTAAETAHLALPGQIEAALDRPLPEIDESIRRLAANRVWFLAPGTTSIRTANPFCAVPSKFRANVVGRTYWGGCIWDALGILAALHADAMITVLCGDCNEQIELQIRGDALMHGGGVVHIAVAALQCWHNIAFT